MSFELDYNKRFATLNAKITAHEQNIKNILERTYMEIGKGDAPMLKSGKFWRKVRSDINKEYRGISSAFNGWSIKEIPSRYNRSLLSMQARIKNLKSVIKLPRKTVTELIKSQTSLQITRALYEDAISSMASAIVGGRNEIFRFTRLTQQAILEERFLDLEIAKAINEGNLRKAIPRIARSFPKGMLENERFVRVGSKHYKPSYYAQMVSRVKFHEAQASAAVATANNYDTDLVIVSSHNTRTAICLPYEGKIFSLNGKNKDFPILDQTPPFHPNCLHLLFPQFAEALHVTGTYSGAVAFANGDALRPPHQPGFIPVKNRKVA